MDYPAPGLRPSYPAHKSFNNLNLLLVNVQSLWSCAHYFQWKPCRLTHVNKDITSLRLNVATCFEETASLFNVHLSFFVDLILCPTEKYMSKVNNKKIILICWKCSKLKINTAWHCSGVFVADFDHSQHVNRVFLLLTLNKCLSAECKKQVIMFWNTKSDIFVSY